ASASLPVSRVAEWFAPLMTPVGIAWSVASGAALLLAGALGPWGDAADHPRPAIAESVEREPRSVASPADGIAATEQQPMVADPEPEPVPPAVVQIDPL